MLLPVVYDDLRLDAALRLDLVVEDRVVVELKAVEMLTAVHKAQVLTYLKLSGYRLAAVKLQQRFDKGRNPANRLVTSWCLCVLVVYAVFGFPIPE